MNKVYSYLVFLIFGLYLNSALCALADQPSYVTAKLIANTKAIIPGQPFKLGVQLIMQPGWHTYYKEPGDAGMPTKIIWQLPSNFKTSSLNWQKPTRFDEAGIITYGYKEKTIITTEVSPPKTLGQVNSVDLTAQVNWLSCKGICVPGKAEIHLTLPVISAEKASNTDLSDNNDEFSTASTIEESTSNSKLATYFIFAFIGGFLLNFMPCVLPVVAIKILSLLEQTDKNRARKTVIAFSTGILSSFLLLGLIVISLQSAGQKIGWGFQFQQPVFLMVMCALVLLFALSLFGLFNFSACFGQNTVNKLSRKEGLSGDFFKGVLATILSTPCTAPFLGTALGFAFVESPVIIITIFLAVGLGMCLPYLLIIFKAEYLKFLPKPGDWMTKLKEAFGFVLLATVVWLLSILYYQIPTVLVNAFVYFLLSLSFAAWLIYRFTDLCSSQKHLLTVSGIALLIVLTSGYFSIYQNRDLLSDATSENTTSSTSVETFDQKILEDALDHGKTVFLDFTAKWCLTCQLNEATVINTKNVQDKLRALNVLFLKVDWTKQDPIVTKLLRKFDRSGVPLYVIYPGKNPSSPIVLPELITKEMVLKKLDEAGPSLRKN